MNHLAKELIDAHGGLETWRTFSSVRAHLKQGGALWALKGQGGKLDDVTVTAALDRQWASHAPFGSPDVRSSFTKDRVALESNAGLVEELRAPRDSFAGHTLTTAWSDLQLAFFAGTAMWTYLNVPFVLAWPGVQSEESGTWEENGETWRRLLVHYPSSLEVFSKHQTLYVGPDGRLRRMDYDVEIAGNTPGAHYVRDYVEVSGISFPTHREIFPRQPDGSAAKEPLVVSIDLDSITLSR